MVVVNEGILSMIKKGVSLNKISQQTGIGKSTLYFHYKKINGKKTIPIIFNFSNQDELGEFIGIFAGDGTFSKKTTGHYAIRISVGYYEKHYADALKVKFEEWFSKKPQYYFGYNKGKKTVVILQYYSRDIYKLIKNYLEWEGIKTFSVRLKKLNFEEKEFNLGFLRGLIDTDGSFYLPKRRISFSTTSESLANQAFLIMEDLVGVTPKKTLTKKEGRHDLYTLTFHGANTTKLLNIIKPRNINKKAVLV